MSTSISTSRVRDITVRLTGFDYAGSIGELAIYFDNVTIYLRTAQARELIGLLAKGIATVAPDSVSEQVSA